MAAKNRKPKLQPGADLDAAVELVRSRLGRSRPALAIILGSGFHGVSALVRAKASFDYGDVPSFPRTGVKGHSGRLVVGTIGDLPVLLLSGRAHYYEGYSMREIGFPVRVLAKLGIRDLLVTNAAGGINRRFKVGDFMTLTDHINLMGANPLRPDRAGEWDGRFQDLSAVYDAELGALVKRAARAARVRLRSGVYLAVSGPSYETPAEIAAFGRLGADAVGMSTVPEVVTARHCGLRVAGLSLITNPAAGIGGGEITHTEVMETGQLAESAAQTLVAEFCRLYLTR
jgi:purine-nucleoside phosphorylase